jgi:hypothetical protein
MKINRVENWAFKFFCLSTIFITIFSVQAIYNWPPLAEKFSIFLACALPTGMIIQGRAGIWLKTRQIPKEFIWVLLIFIFGVLSCLQSENQVASLKSMGLFLASGPLVFFTARTLFESEKNKESYLWMTSLCMLAFALWGIYEYFAFGIVYLFSRNPLPAGALLILLSAGPLILLNRPNSTIIKLTLVLALAASSVLIILMAKKSHLLGLLVFLTLLMTFRFRIYYKFLLGFIFFIGLAFSSSDSLIVKYKNMMSLPNPLPVLSPINENLTKPRPPFALYGSIPLRAENYFFGFHVIRENPIWGLGFNADLDPFFEDYKLRLGNYFSKERYREYIKTLNTFENIILTYLIEWGSLFSFVYFGGIIYIVAPYFREANKTSMDMDGILVLAIVISFSIMSFTFDTLRFPNINWAFHSLLGLMVKITSKKTPSHP